MDAVKKGDEPMDDDAIEDVAAKNVDLSIERIRKESQILSQMEEDGEIEIVGALYDVSNGEVAFK